MSEHIKEFVEDAMKMRDDVKDTFKEWQQLCHEAEVIKEAEKTQQEELKSRFCKKKKNASA